MRRLALLAGLVVLATLAAPATASPQPTPVCRFCGHQFEGAAADAGVNATVSNSAVLVRVHDDGSATWTARLELSNGTDAFAASPGRLDATAQALLADSYGLPQGATFLDASLEGDTAVLRYRDPDAAERHAGLLVVDYLHDRGGQPWYHVNADRFTVRGPDGSVVANDPESGQVDGAGVTWRGKGTGEVYTGTDLEGSPYVVFGPDRSSATRLRAGTAVALATLPIVLDGIGRFVLFQTGLFALVLAGVVAAFGRWAPGPRIDLLAGVIGTLGVIGVVVPAAMNGLEWVAGPPLLALGLAGLAFAPSVRDALRRPRTQAIAVGGLLAVSYVLLLGIHLALADQYTNPPAIALRATALAFPVAAMVPLGGALARRPDRVRPWFAAAVAGFVVTAATLVNLADPPAGLSAGVFAVFLAADAVAAPLVGGLGLALGWSLAGGAGQAAGRSDVAR